MMRLTCHIRHLRLGHKAVVHRILAVILRQRHGHLHLERAVVTRHGLAFLHHFLRPAVAEIAAFPVPRVCQPPERHLTTDGIFHFRTLHGHTGIAHGLTLGTHGIALLVRRLIFVKLHLERRTLVFFYANGRRRVVGSHRKASVQQALRQCQFRGTLTIAVGGHPLLCHHLIIGVTQFHMYALVLHGDIVQCRLFLPYDSRHMHRLARTVYRTVRKHAGMFRRIFPRIIGITTAGTRRRVILVALRIGHHLRRCTLGEVTHQLPLVVTCQRIGLRLLFPPSAVLQSHRSLGDGLSRACIDDDIAHLLFRHGLRHQSHTRHEIQFPRRLRLGRRPFYHIHTGLQCGQFHGVLKTLIVLMTAEMQRPRQVCPQRQVRLHLLIVFLDVGIQLRIALQIRAIHLHGQRLDVPQRCQLHGLTLLGHRHPMRHGGRKRRTCHVRFFVTQPVGTLPRTPLLQRLAQISDALLDGSFIFLVHHAQPLDGYLAGLGQVTIHRRQRVQRRLVVEGFDTRQTCCPAVARLRVVFVQPLPRLQRPSYHVQQVVAIVRLAVLALDDEGFIRLGLHLRQRLGMQHRLLTVFRCLVG